MKVKTLSLLAFSIQLVFGNLCMMPMAFAQEMNMSQAMHMDQADMMSYADGHCEYCPDQSHALDQKMPEKPSCNGGHCFIEAVPPASTNAGSLDLLGSAVPPVIATISTDYGSQWLSNTPPGVPIPTDTIVLRF